MSICVLVSNVILFFYYLMFNEEEKKLLSINLKWVNNK